MTLSDIDEIIEQVYNKNPVVEPNDIENNKKSQVGESTMNNSVN